MNTPGTDQPTGGPAASPGIDGREENTGAGGAPPSDAASDGGANTAPPRSDAANGPGPSLPSLPIDIDPDSQRLVWDAMELLEFAVQSGFKTQDGRHIPDSIIEPILTMVSLLGRGAHTSREGVAAHEPAPEGAVQSGAQYLLTERTQRKLPRVTVSSVEWAAFLSAYRGLAELMHPVTARSLRETKQVAEVSVSFFKWFFRGRHLPKALRVSRVLWITTLLFAAYTIGVDWGTRYLGPPLDGAVGPEPPEITATCFTWDWLIAHLCALIPTLNTIMQGAEILVPFMYGGMGACVYLLRSAHTYIAERSFDPYRIPEYTNRVVLGMISGGAIVLLVNNITNDSGEVVKLSSAALGFIAGYSSDFLFQTIERIVSAILPKVGIETVRKETMPSRSAVDVPVGELTLKDLLDRYAQAQGDDKRLYGALIAKLQERM
jgi:hypothetical protein